MVVEEEEDKNASSGAVCDSAREWMLKDYKHQATAALRYYTDEEVPRLTPFLLP
jgi:hypothetical protein